MRPSPALAALLATTSLLGLGLGGCVTDDGDDHTAGFEAAYEETSDGKADDSGCSGVRVPDQGRFGKKVVLTFDDGPNPATTPTVIETLRRHNAKATFFINGSRMGSQAAKDIAADIASDPSFILANHSQNHTDLGVVGAGKVEAEFAKTDALIREAGETPKFFRFPFGSASCAGAQVIRDHGNIITGWHIDSADWCYAASGGATCKKSTFKHVPDDQRNDMKGYILSQVRAHQGGILLMHDIHASSANALDGILTTLEAEGYTFVGLDDATVLPRLNGVAPVPTRFIGDACASDADCSFTVAGEAGHCHAAGYCTVSCEGSCPDSAGKAPTFCIADGASATGGSCASKAAAQNSQCAALPGTVKALRDRFIGSSGSSASQASVCAPAQ